MSTHNNNDNNENNNDNSDNNDNNNDNNNHHHHHDNKVGDVPEKDVLALSAELRKKHVLWDSMCSTAIGCQALRKYKSGQKPNALRTLVSRQYPC